jgi:magnesium chelatase family protein
VIQHLSGQGILPFFAKKEEEDIPTNYIDFRQIVGHSQAKYALEVAAAGEHHLFMTGPPGCGKSMLAESFSSILPPLTKEAQLEMISLYQLSGNSYPHIRQPPFRNPHHWRFKYIDYWWRALSEAWRSIIGPSQCIIFR